MSVSFITLIVSNVLTLILGNSRYSWPMYTPNKNTPTVVKNLIVYIKSLKKNN